MDPEEKNTSTLNTDPGYEPSEPAEELPVAPETVEENLPQPELDLKKKFTLVDLSTMWFPFNDERYNLDECSDTIFLSWFSQYANVEFEPGASDIWTLEERRDALNFLAAKNVTPAFLSEEDIPA